MGRKAVKKTIVSITNPDLTALEEKVDNISVLLTGNGHPGEGVILRLDRVQIVVNEVKDTVRELAAKIQESEENHEKIRIQREQLEENDGRRIDKIENSLSWVGKLLLPLYTALLGLTATAVWALISGRMIISFR